MKAEKSIATRILSLILLLVLVVSALPLSTSCGIFNPSSDKTTEPLIDLTPYNPPEWGGKPYVICYTSNGDGTCYVSDILYNPNVHEKYTLEIPATSPEGDRVTAVDTGPIAADNVPTIFLEDVARKAMDKYINLYNIYNEYDVMLFKQNHSVKNHIKHIKLWVYYLLRSKDYCETEGEAQLLFERYPFAEYIPFYILDPDTSLWEFYDFSSVLYYLYGFDTTSRQLNTDKIKEILNSYGASALETFPESESKSDRYIFHNASMVSEILLPDTVSMLKDGCFACYYSLKKINLTDNIKEIGEFAFCNCNSLIEIRLPEHLDVMGATAFDSCVHLTCVTLPSSIDKIISEDGHDELFRNCNVLRLSDRAGNKTNRGYITYEPAGITCYVATNQYFDVALEQDDYLWAKTKTGGRVLSYIGEQTDLVIPAYFTDADGKKYDVEEIDSGMFYFNDSIQSIIISSDVEADKDFYWNFCTALESVTFTAGIDASVLSGLNTCRQLKNVTYGGTISQWNALTAAVDMGRIQYSVHCSDGDIAPKPITSETTVAEETTK